MLRGRARRSTRRPSCGCRGAAGFPWRTALVRSRTSVKGEAWTAKLAAAEQLEHNSEMVRRAWFFVSLGGFVACSSPRDAPSPSLETSEPASEASTEVAIDQ